MGLDSLDAIKLPHSVSLVQEHPSETSVSESLVSQSQSITLSVSHTVSQSITQSVSQSVSHSPSQSVIHPVSQPIRQSITQSASQSPSQSPKTVCLPPSQSPKTVCLPLLSYLSLLLPYRYKVHQFVSVLCPGILCHETHC